MTDRPTRTLDEILASQPELRFWGSATTDYREEEDKIQQRFNRDTEKEPVKVVATRR